MSAESNGWVDQQQWVASHIEGAVPVDSSELPQLRDGVSNSALSENIRGIEGYWGPRKHVQGILDAFDAPQRAPEPSGIPEGRPVSLWDEVQTNLPDTPFRYLNPDDRDYLSGQIDGALAALPYSGERRIGGVSRPVSPHVLDLAEEARGRVEASMVQAYEEDEENAKQRRGVVANTVAKTAVEAAVALTFAGTSACSVFEGVQKASAGEKPVVILINPSAQPSEQIITATDPDAALMTPLPTETPLSTSTPIPTETPVPTPTKEATPAYTPYKPVPLDQEIFDDKSKLPPGSALIERLPTSQWLKLDPTKQWYLSCSLSRLMKKNNYTSPEGKQLKYVAMYGSDFSDLKLPCATQSNSTGSLTRSIDYKYPGLLKSLHMSEEQKVMDGAREASQQFMDILGGMDTNYLNVDRTYVLELDLKTRTWEWRIFKQDGNGNPTVRLGTLILPAPTAASPEPVPTQTP